MTRDERGSIAPAAPIIAMALLLLGGLGIDGSRQLNARGEAVAFAEEAARAGAQGIDVSASDLELDPALAEERVNTYCDRVEQLGQVKSCRFLRIQAVSDSDPRQLVVVTEVKLEIDASLLSMIPGVDHLSASATAHARPYEGINAPTS
ncbi:MAG TPA: pilus assembly protein TadG-related protein [Marmoricola sp.]|nr:pilus assembly protein TadG-related protein [Marmoricola sp.]